jgi:hypothetical protein
MAGPRLLLPLIPAKAGTQAFGRKAPEIKCRWSSDKPAM